MVGGRASSETAPAKRLILLIFNASATRTGAVVAAVRQPAADRSGSRSVWPALRRAELVPPRARPLPGPVVGVDPQLDPAHHPGVPPAPRHGRALPLIPQQGRDVASCALAQTAHRFRCCYLPESDRCAPARLGRSDAPRQARQCRKAARLAWPDGSSIAACRSAVQPRKGRCSPCVASPKATAARACCVSSCVAPIGGTWRCCRYGT